MKKTIVIISLISVFCAFNIVPVAMADPDPYSLEQETYLLQKDDQGTDPWTIILPSADAEDIAFGKLEYLNYAMEDGFCFDFKGYDFGGIESGDQDMLIPVDAEYALIYYVDPGVGWPNGLPVVYVLGISSGPCERPEKSKGKAKGLEGVDFKIDGCCEIDQIPALDDVNYPNGGKIWLVPVEYLDAPVACASTTMTGWPAGGAGILFETSLITYGFVPEPELVDP